VLAVTTQPAAAQTGKFKFLSGSGVNAFNVSVGTYKGQLDGRNVDVWCVDFLNHVGAGNQYTVNITGLGYQPDLSKTRFGTFSNQPDRYRQAAWLASQFTSVSATSASWGALHAAIWQIMTPGVVSVSTAMQPQVNHWVGQAASNYKKYYYNNVYVLSDVAIGQCAVTNPAAAPWTGCGKQEHIMIEGGALTVTPEPATMGLLAIGLVGLGGVTAIRRRRQRD
jgi:hypothetical protein